MDVAQAANRLRSLASDNAKRSKTAVLREVFMDIEVAIQAGVSQVVIVEELRTLGLDINQGSFRSALRRLRAGHSSRNPGWSRTSESPDFALSSYYAEFPPSVCTTSAGSIYDAGALCRLIRASGSQPEEAPTALSE
jgi:S-adenosylmethionine/arginine decarboxylase-like enzyme